MDELCVSRKHNVWLWTAVSRYTGQILAYVLADRTWQHVETLHSLLPPRYQRRRVYTDGYEAYVAFFVPSPMQLPDSPPLRPARPSAKHSGAFSLRGARPQPSLSQTLATLTVMPQTALLPLRAVSTLAL